MSEQINDEWRIVQRVAATIRKEFGQNRFMDHSATDIAMSAYRRFMESSMENDDYKSIEDAEDLARVLTRIAKNRALTLSQRSTMSQLVEEPRFGTSEDEVLKDFRAFHARMVEFQDEQTQIVVRSKMDGLAISEIAQKLGVSEATVGRKWKHYCDQLRKAIVDGNGSESE